MKALIDTYSDEEFKKIVEFSNSYSEIAKKLGYSSTSGAGLDRIRKRINELNISTSHFNIRKVIERNEDNIFIENSSADQSTLRRWYIKEQYTKYICSICGQEPVWQNKELTLILDHINGINNDDRLENLRWVCPNCNQQLDTTGSKNQNRKNLAKKYYCIDCGKEVSKNSKRCLICSSKNRIVPNEQMSVSKEELKNLIRIMPFTLIAKKFNVTDNAVRKWCDKYNLPRKKSDINEYTDEEWSKI